MTSTQIVCNTLKHYERLESRTMVLKTSFSIPCLQCQKRSLVNSKRHSKRRTRFQLYIQYRDLSLQRYRSPVNREGLKIFRKTSLPLGVRGFKSHPLHLSLLFLSSLSLFTIWFIKTAVVFSHSNPYWRLLENFSI